MSLLVQITRSTLLNTNIVAVKIPIFKIHINIQI